MTTRTSTSALFQVFVAACAVVGVATSAPLAQAEPATPPAATAVSTQQPKPEKKSTPKAARSTAGKTKSPARAAKPAKTSAPSATTTAESKDESAASAKPSQVMDFDTDDVAGTRLEPGFELIEGAPAKARHKSLVEPLKPGDSVVRRE